MIEIYITPFGMFLTLSMCILMLFLPRKYASIPLFIITCYTTLGQRLLIESLDFYIFRIFIVFGWIRLLIRREIFKLRFNAVDKVLIWLTIVSIVTYTISWRTLGALINRMGMAYNAIGIYFLFRFLIRDFKDVEQIIKALAIIIVPLSFAALIENETGRNIFAIFGGVAEFSPIRDGKIRCTISMGDAILAGTFGATMMPLFIGLFFRNKSSRALAFVAIISSTIITFLSHSVGPLLAYLGGIVGFMMWPLQKNMRAVRWGLLAGLLTLHLIMKAPVWAIFGRISEFIGGTGYHRFELIDAFIKHFGEWWLIGTKYTAHWGPTILINEPNMVDITNQYILIGIEGGLLAMFLFFTLIVYSFRAIGRAIWSMIGQPFTDRIFVWSFGVTLFTHTISFMSVAYFTQLVVFWYMLLAIISSYEVRSKRNKNEYKCLCS